VCVPQHVSAHVCTHFQEGHNTEVMFLHNVTSALVNGNMSMLMKHYTHIDRQSCIILYRTRVLLSALPKFLCSFYCLKLCTRLFFWKKKNISIDVNRFISFCLGGPNFDSIQNNGEVKERVGLHFNSTSGHSWRVMWWPLPLHYLHISSSPVTC